MKISFYFRKLFHNLRKAFFFWIVESHELKVRIYVHKFLIITPLLRAYMVADGKICNSKEKSFPSYYTAWQNSAFFCIKASWKNIFLEVIKFLHFFFYYFIKFHSKACCCCREWKIYPMQLLTNNRSYDAQLFINSI